MRCKFAFLILSAVLIQASAADSPAEEYRVKAAFLLNFANFVEWPSQAFHGPGDAISICVLGANPFSPEMDAAARKMVAENRLVTVRQIADYQQARECQIVFVGLSERKRVHALLEAVQDDSVLTVGESEGFVASGGVIEFKVEESRVKMEISAAAAKRAKLTISSRLLNLVQPSKR